MLSQKLTAGLRYGHVLVSIDPVAEARLRWKIDLYIIPTVALLYLFCFIDRANIGMRGGLHGQKSSLSDKQTFRQRQTCGIRSRLKLGRVRLQYRSFNLLRLVHCFRNPLCYGLQMDRSRLVYSRHHSGIWHLLYLYGFCDKPRHCCRRSLSPWPFRGRHAGKHILSTLFSYSGVFGVFWVTGLHPATFAQNNLKGVAADTENLQPGIAYYLSRWYRRSELVFRLSLYIVMSPLAGAFGGLLASAILTLPNFGNLTRWRMIFAIEGIITCGLALIGFVTMTDRPASARWLSQDEKDLAIVRLKAERIGTTEVLDKVDTKKMLRGIFSPVTLATSWIFFLDNITVQGLAFFAPTIVKTIYPTDTVVSQQLHTVPPYVVGAFFVLAFSYASWKLDRRIIFSVISAPFMMVGYIMFLASTSPSVRYAATFLIAIGAFPFGTLGNAHVSANVLSDTARSSAIGTNTMLANIGGVISTWAFLPFDGPNYPIGNGLNLATSSLALISSIALLFWMKFDNKKRAKKDIDAELEGLSQQQIQDLDWAHPGFRWKP